MEMGSSSLGGASGSGPGSVSSDSLNGLKFGKKIYFEDGGGGVSAIAGGFAASSEASGSSSMAPKKGKGAVQAGQPPRCQVEGCMVDLTGAKAYYCRHKVCAMHSKSPKVIVAGLEKRFCQQCSRFHQLPEFDQGKRSCRRRLAGHNERRRKPPLGSLLSRYGRFSSSFHEDNSRVGGFLMDFTYARALGRDMWPTMKASDPAPTNECSTTGRYTPYIWQMNAEVPSANVLAHWPHADLPSSTSRLPFPSSEFSASESLGVLSSSCALSLLSSQPWSPRNRASDLVANNYLNDEAAAANAHQLIHGTTTSSFAGNTWSFRDHESSGNSHYMTHELGPRRVPGQVSSQFTGELESGQQYMGLQQSRAYNSSSHQMNWSR